MIYLVVICIFIFREFIIHNLYFYSIFNYILNKNNIYCICQYHKNTIINTNLKMKIAMNTVITASNS